jgi:V/A-type H+-transporting ATPase subunit D
MTRALLNKSVLAQESRKLARCREFLPALDLKRRQLLVELLRERQVAREQVADRERILGRLGQQVPMLANEDIDLEGLAVLDSVQLNEQNVLGCPLPVIESLVVRTAPYSLLAKPHWVDDVARALEAVLRLDVAIDVALERVRRLENASRVVTQRVNLFEKVLIPRSEALIRQIRISLADAERYAAVRGKFAKRAALRRVGQQPAQR